LVTLHDSTEEEEEEEEEEEGFVVGSTVCALCLIIWTLIS
jgi:hypothetical protein